MSLQRAIVNLLERKLNEAYWSYVDSGGTITDHYNYFKCSTIFDYNFDSFKQYDINNRLIVDEYGNAKPFIPVIVGAINGDREAIPGCFISDITLDLSLIVGFDDVDTAIQTITLMTNDSIGKIYELDYKDENDNAFNFAFLPDLPDFSDFIITQGQKSKDVSLTLSGILSANVEYGNSIEYAISYDNGTTFENIIKVNPTTQRNNDLYQDQIIGEGFTKGFTKTSTWSKSLTFYCYKDSTLARMLVFMTDFPYSQVSEDIFGNEYTDSFTPQFVLQITYNQYLDNSVEPKPIVKTKPIIIDEISYSDDIGSFMTISISMKDRF